MSEMAKNLEHLVHHAAILEIERALWRPAII